MADEDKKITKHLDRLVMGIILGGAIGSVLGLTLAPRKGKETREILKKKSQELLEKGKNVSEKFVRDHHETFQSAKFEFKKGKKSFLQWLFKRKQKSQPMPRVFMEEQKSIHTHDKK